MAARTLPALENAPGTGGPQECGMGSARSRRDPRMPLLAAIGLLAASLAAAPAAGDVALSPAAARPGDAVLIRLARPGTGPEPGGTLGDRTLSFWRKGGELWAIAGLPIETPPGSLPVDVAWSGPDPRRASAALEVVEPGFRSRTLSVAPRFVEPPPEAAARIAADHAAFADAYARPFGPPLFAGSFGWPRRARTNGRYGDQRVLNGKKDSVHYGLDISGPRGAAIAASNDGEVVLVRDCYYSGNTVVLWHGADLFTLYFHLDRISVRAGERVRKGQRIGTLGSTGRSTGPHLHWSARVGGLLVDPESLLAIDFVRGTAQARQGARPPPAQRELLPPPDPGPPAVAPAPAGEADPIAARSVPPQAAPAGAAGGAPGPSQDPAAAPGAVAPATGAAAPR